MPATSPNSPDSAGYSSRMNGATRDACFVQRDYSKGLGVQFETQMPDALRSRVSPEVWERTISHINARFKEAEQVCANSVLETVFGCLTCYLSRLFTKTQYDKKLDEIGRFIEEENEETYEPFGVHIMHPIERGLRVIEIHLFPPAKCV